MEQAVDKPLLFTSSFKDNGIFIGKMFLFLLLAFLFFHHIEPQYEGSYNASLIDKVKRLKSIDEPKIVLLGNSNIVFGIDSEMIEQRCEMPVVNMGLHGGLGNAFHENMAGLNVHEGDIYILCHSNYADNDAIGNPELAWITIENHYELWSILRPKDLKQMAEAFPVYLKKSLDLHSSGSGNQDDGSAYSRSGFNKYGDCGIIREKCYKQMDPVRIPGINDIAVNRINRLNRFLSEKGAVLLIAGYPIGSGEMTDDIRLFEEFQNELDEKIDAPVISDFTDYMYDYDFFYDYNHLHLNSEGTKLRTEQLIKDIESWAEENEE